MQNKPTAKILEQVFAEVSKDPDCVIILPKYLQKKCLKFLRQCLFKKRILKGSGKNITESFVTKRIS